MTKEQSISRMKKWRKAMGYTQQQAGDLLGCTRGNICNIEKGRQILTDAMWEAMKAAGRK